MIEVLTSQPVITAEQLEEERYDFIKGNLAQTAILLAATLNSAPKPYNLGLEHLPADVYND